MSRSTSFSPGCFGQSSRRSAPLSPAVSMPSRPCSTRVLHDEQKQALFNRLYDDLEVQRQERIGDSRVPLTGRFSSSSTASRPLRPTTRPALRCSPASARNSSTPSIPTESSRSCPTSAPLMPVGSRWSESSSPWMRPPVARGPPRLRIRLAVLVPADRSAQGFGAEIMKTMSKQECARRLGLPANVSHEVLRTKLRDELRQASPRLNGPTTEIRVEAERQLDELGTSARHSSRARCSHPLHRSSHRTAGPAPEPSRCHRPRHPPGPPLAPTRPPPRPCRRLRCSRPPPVNGDWGNNVDGEAFLPHLVR